MKTRILITTCLLATAASLSAQQRFSVKGNVDGLPAHSKVILVGTEGQQEKPLAEAEVKNGQFALSGEARRLPLLGRLSFYVPNSKGEERRVAKLRLMVANGETTVKADGKVITDDELYDTQKEALVNIKGTREATEYDSYLNATRAVERTKDSASYASAKAWFDNHGDEENTRDYKERAAAALRDYEAAVDRFITEHPDYAVSAALVAEKLYQDFHYTADYYDHMAALVSQNADTAHVHFIERNLALAKQYALGAHYTDFQGMRPDSTSMRLSQLTQPGKHTLIDFWASWCGPCRSAIPKVEALYEKYGDWLQVVSVSVDQKEEAWRKAEREEQMPWPQLWVSGKEMERVADAYRIQSIPRLVLLSPEGRVLLATHDVTLVEDKLTDGRGFSLTSRIGGLSEGAKVELRRAEGHSSTTLATATVRNGQFELRGMVAHPTLCELEIDDKAEYADGEYAERRGIKLMVGNEPLLVTAESYAAMPLTYTMFETQLPLERNVNVEGGEAQRHYREWRDATYEEQLAVANANFSWRDYAFGLRHEKGDDPNKEKQLKEAELQARNTLEQKNDAFIQTHPDYAISLLLQQERLEEMFAYSAEELAEMKERFRHNEDTVRYAQFARQIDELANYTKGRAYIDLTVELPDGQQKLLSQYVKKGRLTLVDFWASWCGPCRAAIPSVKDLQKEMGTKVNIVSASLDKDKAAWKKAMEQEQMTWTQLLVPQTEMKKLKEGYQVNAIPYLLIIDGRGRVVLTTHSADEAHEYIKKNTR